MEGGLYHVSYQFVVNMITHWPVKQVDFYVRTYGMENDLIYYVNL